MTSSEPSSRRRNPARRYALILVGALTAVVAGSTTWKLLAIKGDMLRQANADAQTALDKDLLFRRWAAGHGGVYVPASESTPPNRLLAHVPERDVETSSGRRLTLMDPAYMMRQVYETERTESAPLGHITSLNPIRAANAPDPWERRALEALGDGSEEVRSIEMIDGAEHVRLMRPVYAERACLSCHEAQSYKEGDVRGGVSVATPLARYWAQAPTRALPVVIGHLLLWGMGLGGIGLAHRGLARSTRQRDNAEHPLGLSEQRYREFAELTDDLVTQVDRDGRLAFVNHAAANILGLDSKECVGLSAFEFVHPDDRARTEEAFAEWLKDRRTNIGFENRQISRSGEVRNMLWSIHIEYDEDERHRIINGIARDVTARRRAEETLRQAHDKLARANAELGEEIDIRRQTERMLLEHRQRLRKLAFELSQAEDREGRRLAEALHDGIGQSLYAMKMKIASLRVMDWPEERLSMMDDVLALLDRTIGDARTMTFELCPPALFAMGLPAGLEWLIEQFNARGGASYAFGTNVPNGLLNADVRALAFRAARELLVNAEKHSAAETVIVRLGIQDGRLLIEVTDDGVGFDESAVAKNEGDLAGFGLFSIGERLTQLGGRLGVESTPGAGAKVTVAIPVAPPPETGSPS